MDSPSQDNPKIEGTPTTSESPHIEYDSYLHPERPYTTHHDEIKVFRRITIGYTRNIRAFPLSLFLPRRKKTSRSIVNTLDHTFVHTVEDIVEFYLTEIDHPLSFIRKTPLITPPTSTYSDLDYSKSEGVNSKAIQKALITSQIIWNITMNKFHREMINLQIIIHGWPWMP
jgi:hypothetical protein